MAGRELPGGWGGREKASTGGPAGMSDHLMAEETTGATRSRCSKVD
jgi:hypothetical protein